MFLTVRCIDELHEYYKNVARSPEARKKVKFQAKDKVDWTDLDNVLYNEPDNNMGS